MRISIEISRQTTGSNCTHKCVSNDSCVPQLFLDAMKTIFYATRACGIADEFIKCGWTMDFYRYIVAKWHPVGFIFSFQLIFFVVSVNRLYWCACDVLLNCRKRHPLLTWRQSTIDIQFSQEMYTSSAIFSFANREKLQAIKMPLISLCTSATALTGGLG